MRATYSVSTHYHFACMTIILKHASSATTWQFYYISLIYLILTLTKTHVQSLVWEYPLEEGMANHSSILTWRIQWSEWATVHRVTKSDMTYWLNHHHHIIDTFSTFIKFLQFSCPSSLSADGPTSSFTEKIEASRRAPPPPHSYHKSCQNTLYHILCLIILPLGRGYLPFYLQLTLLLGTGSNCHLHLSPPGFAFFNFLSSLLHHQDFLLHLGHPHHHTNLTSFAAAAAKTLLSCPTLCDPIDGSPPGSNGPGILQARTLEWVAISFSRAWKWKMKVKSLVVSDSSWPHGLQPSRLLRPWDFPGKSTGVGCHCLLRDFIYHHHYHSQLLPDPSKQTQLMRCVHFHSPLSRLPFPLDPTPLTLITHYGSTTALLIINNPCCQIPWAFPSSHLIWPTSSIWHCWSLPPWNTFFP